MHRCLFLVLACLISQVSGRRLQSAAPRVQGRAVKGFDEPAEKAAIRKPFRALADLLLAFNALHSTGILRGTGAQPISGRSLSLRVARLSLQLNNASHVEVLSDSEPVPEALRSASDISTQSVRVTANESVSLEEAQLAVENMTAALQQALSGSRHPGSNTNDNALAALLQGQGKDGVGNFGGFSDMMQNARTSDAFITNRVPALQKIKRFVLAAFFVYCFRRGWIGHWGLFFGIFANSYFDTLAIPLRVLPDSPLQGQSYFLVRALVDMSFGAGNYAFELATGRTSLKDKIAPVREAFKEAQQNYEEAKKRSDEARNPSNESQQAEQQVVDLDPESNASSTGPFGGFFDTTEQPDASDKFITDRFPILQTPKKVLLLFFYGYCFKKGWIENYGLVQGALMSRSYFDVLAVPLRVLPESLLYGKPFFVTQAIVDLMFRAMKWFLKLPQHWAKLQEQVADFNSQQEKAVAEQQQAMADQPQPEVPAWLSSLNSSAGMFGGQQQNATDAFITNRVPALKKSKRPILALFFALCWWQGWIGHWGFVYGSFSGKSYFDMLAVPALLYPNSPWFEKPLYIAMLYLDLGFRAMHFTLRLLRGENPFKEMWDKNPFKAMLEKGMPKEEDGVIDVESKSVEAKSEPQPKSKPQGSR